MDLQTRKLNLIEYLVNITDEKIIKIIEDMINMSKSENNRIFEPFTQQEFVERAKKSSQDYSHGNFKTQDRIEVESNNW